MARAAIAAAEAAGTREIRREDRAIVSPEQAEASKLERLANQAPQIIVPRPGTDEAGAMQVTTPDSTAGGEEEGR
ncbi:MAG: hypothetical protein QUU85_13750 [Candidatus Eisenbacteria bacterium]|nr:hypothetical protein [Candidatus Eisenbacteria bacterium]